MPEIFRKNGKPPQYANPGFFTYKIHHDGRLIKKGRKEVYTGGEVIFLDWVDGDMQSLVECHNIAEDLKYEEELAQYKKLPDGTFEEMKCDADVMNLIEDLPANRIVDLYMVQRSSHNWKKEIYEVQSSTQVDKQVMTKNELFDVVVNLDEELQITHSLNWDGGFGDFGIGQQGHEGEAATCNSGGNENESNAGGVNEDGDGEEEEECTDNELIDSDYEQEEEDDIPAAQFEEQLYEEDDNMFLENVDNPIEEEPEEMGLIGEISDDEALSGDLDSIVDSEEDEEGVEVTSKRRRQRAIQMPKFKQWKRATDLQDPNFEMGMLFPNKEQLKEAIVHYSCNNGRKIWFKKNDNVRIRVNCENGCPFLLHGGRLHNSHTFQIKTLVMKHECSRDEKVYWLNSRFLASKYSEQLMIDPDWSIEAFKAAVKRDYGQELSTQQIYRARQRAEKANKGSWVEQYNKLGQYVEVLKETNPGSTVVLKTQMRGNVCKFQRIYICFDACKKGFKEGCRPVIGLDGCFVKGQHPGQILAAVGIDANNGMFPVAYAIVEIENQSTWEWFIEMQSIGTV